MWGVPAAAQWINIWHCHSCGVGFSRGSESVPGLGTSICHRISQKRKKKKNAVTWFFDLKGAIQPLKTESGAQGIKMMGRTLAKVTILCSA